MPAIAMREPVVLIAVLKDRRDLRLVRREHWYRIPVARAPKRAFRWLAFYQTAAFGRNGGRIRYYAPVRDRGVALRRDLLPREAAHPRSDALYHRYALGPVRDLPVPVRNAGPRRVTFGFTTLGRLLRARDLLELFEVAPIESILRRALVRAGVPAAPERTVTEGRRRVRVDLAVFCRRGPVAVECDGATHAGRAQRRRDRLKDALLGRRGWKVLRFAEAAILSDPRGCARRVAAAVRRRGGPAPQ